MVFLNPALFRPVRKGNSAGHTHSRSWPANYACRFVFLFLFPLACDEHLPPRRDPTDLFTARSEITWSLSSLENRIYLRLVLRNTYDEIVEGTADIEGKLSISIARDPSYTRTYDLTGLQIDDVPYYNRSTGLMSIPPGDSMSFFIAFNWLDDVGRDFRSGFIYQPDPLCTGRMIARREILIVQGEARLFQRVMTATATPLMFELCHVDVWVNPKFCPPIFGPTQGCLELGWGK